MIDVGIVYCKHCDYLPRAREISEGLKDAFKEDVDISLDPGSTGIFDVYVGQELVFSKYKELRFPSVDEVKAMVESKLAIVSSAS